MPIDAVKKVLVLGAGTMGSQISLLSAARGYKVAVYDVSEQALQMAPVRQKMYIQRAVQMGRATFVGADRVDSVVAGITFTTDKQKAAENADLVSESVTESVAVKQKVHGEFEKLVPPDCILTTNTSSLLASAIDPVLTRPERFAAMHFHGGMTLLVDIMRGSKTSAATVDTLRQFVRSLGLVPMVMKKEKGGYLYNTLLGAHLRTALMLVVGGYAEPQEVDRAWMLVTGQTHGPFAAMDGVGLDVVAAAGQGLMGEPEIDRDQLLAFLRPYLEKGELGAKTGKGFYTWPNPAFLQPGFLTGEDK